MASKSKSENPHTGDGASPGKIFDGGLAKDTTHTKFNEHFGKHREITDSEIMKSTVDDDPLGFGCVVYNEEVVDEVLSKESRIDVSGTPGELT